MMPETAVGALVDSHCHFDLDDFGSDRDALYDRARAAGVAAQIVPAISFNGWAGLRQVVARYPKLYPAYGLHPLFVAHHSPRHLDLLGEWLERHAAVAVGECGLDGWVEGVDWSAQVDYFTAQLAIARSLDLPVIVHARRALDQVIKHLRRQPGARGVVHSFVGSEQQAQQLIDLGFYLGVGGPVTYPRAQRLHRVVRAVAVEALLLETDAPFQPLMGYQGERNEPAQTRQVLRVVAELREASEAAIARATTANAEQLFAIAVQG